MVDRWRDLVHSAVWRVGLQRLGFQQYRATLVVFEQGNLCAVNNLIHTLWSCVDGLYHFSSLQVCMGICGGEGAVIQLCALNAERWSHIKRMDFPLRALSLSSTPSVQQFDGQLKPKLWLTAADPQVITHDRGSLGSGSLFQKSTQEGPVYMCVQGILGKNRLTVPSTTPYFSTERCWGDVNAMMFKFKFEHLF